MRVILSTLMFIMMMTITVTYADTNVRDHEQRVNDYLQAVEKAKLKVMRFKEAIKSRDPVRIKKETLKIQEDPAAIKELNKESNFIKNKVVKTTDAIQAETIENIKQRVARQYNVKPEDVKIKKFTNPSDKIKAGHDWDVTVSIEGKDIHYEDVREIVHESYFEAAGGKKAYPHSDATTFSKEHHVEVTSEHHGEAYEGGEKYVHNPEGYDVKDSERLSKTIEHKSDLDRNKAVEYAEHGEYGKSEVYKHEQARQYTKQYDKHIEPRIKNMHGKVAKTVREGTKILKKIGKYNSKLKRIYTPADADVDLAKLGKYGETVESIIRKGSALVESDQKIKTLSKVERLKEKLKNAKKAVESAKKSADPKKLRKAKKSMKRIQKQLKNELKSNESTDIKPEKISKRGSTKEGGTTKETSTKPSETIKGKIGKNVGEYMEGALVMGQAQKAREGIKEGDSEKIKSAFLGEDTAKRTEGGKRYNSDMDKYESAKQEEVLSALTVKLKRMRATKKEIESFRENYGKDSQKIASIIMAVKARGGKDTSPHRSLSADGKMDDEMSKSVRAIEAAKQTGSYGKVILDMMSMGGVTRGDESKSDLSDIDKQSDRVLTETENLIIAKLYIELRDRGASKEEAREALKNYPKDRSGVSKLVAVLKERDPQKAKGSGGHKKGLSADNVDIRKDDDGWLTRVEETFKKAANSTKKMLYDEPKKLVVGTVKDLSGEGGSKYNSDMDKYDAAKQEEVIAALARKLRRMGATRDEIESFRENYGKDRNKIAKIINDVKSRGGKDAIGQKPLDANGKMDDEEKSEIEKYTEEKYRELRGQYNRKREKLLELGATESEAEEALAGKAGSVSKLIKALKKEQQEENEKATKKDELAKKAKESMVQTEKSTKVEEGKENQEIKGTGQDNNIKPTPPVGNDIPDKNDLKGKGKTEGGKPKQPEVPKSENKKPQTIQNPDIKANSKDGETTKTVSPEKNKKTEKEWISKIEEAYRDRDCAKMRQINSKMQYYAKDNKTPIGYKYPVAGKLLKKYQAQMAREKEKWFKKGVLKYLRKVKSLIGGQDPYDKAVAEGRRLTDEEEACHKIVKSERKKYDKSIKEHKEVLRRLFDLQGSDMKICNTIEKFVKKYEIPISLKIPKKYKNVCNIQPQNHKFSIKISGQKNIFLFSKESVTLEAEVVGGKSPVTVSWEGENISPSGPTAIFVASTPGSYTVQVVAKDASGQSAYDAVSIKVEQITLPVLSGLPNEVYYGTSKIVSVEGTENNAPKDKPSSNDPCKGVDQSKITNPFDPCLRLDPKDLIDSNSNIDGPPGVIMLPADDTEVSGVPEVKKEKEGEYEYVWQPSGEGLEFDPPYGKQPQVKVTFGNIGNVEIWAEVHKDGEYIGDTERIKTNVIPPKFTLTVKPVAPYVSEECIANIKVEPDIDNKYLDFTWPEMGDNVHMLGTSDEDRSYRFEMKNTNKTTLNVWVLAVPYYTENPIADLKQVISAKPYKVDVKVLGPLGPKPMVWKEGKGLVEVESEIALHENVRLKATVEPKPKSDIHYAWTLNEDSHFAGGDWGSEVMVNRSQTGSCVATVTVKDGDGNVLGKGSASFSVTDSQQQPDKGKQKAKALLQKSRKLWKEGKLQQAIAKVAQAQKLAGKDKEVAKTLKAMQRQKKELDAKLDKASDLIKKGKMKDAEAILSQAAMISDKYKKYKEVLKQLTDAKKKAEEKKKQIAKLLKDAKVLKDAGKLDEAVALLAKGVKQFPGNKEIDKLLIEVQKQQSDAEEILKQGEKQWKNGMLDKALSSLKQAIKKDPSNKKASKTLKIRQIEKKIMEKSLKKCDKFIKSKKFSEAKSEFEKAKYVSRLYPPYIDMLKRLNNAQKEEKKRKEELAKKVKAIKERIVKEKKAKAAAKKKAEAKKAALAKKINDIKIAIEAKEKAEAQKREEAKKAALVKKIQDIKAVAKKAAEVKAEKERKESRTAKADTVSKKYVLGFAGKWNSTYGVMTLTVQGLHVSGNYTHDKGRIEAILSEDGKTMKGTWAESPSYKGSRDAGKMYFKLSSDAKKIDGLWSYGDAVPTRKWTATRIIDTQPQAPGVVQPGQKPPKETEGIKQPSKNDSSQSNSITILSATYGANCGMSNGNVTPHIAKACNGKSSCRYTVDYKKIGDPAIGCRKTYSVQYRCGNNPQVLKEALAAEAGWGDKSILLDCRQHNQPKDDTPPSNISSLVGSWSFGRSKHYGKPVQEHLCNLTLTDEHVKGIGYKIKSCNANASYWILEGKVLLFVLDGTITTKFSEVRPNYWKGTCVGSAHSAEGIVFYLRKSDEGEKMKPAKGKSTGKPIETGGKTGSVPHSTINYIGCYKEKGYDRKIVPSLEDRDMNGDTFRSSNMTIDMCTQYCTKKGFSYAALQYARECYCDDSYGSFGKADNCNMACTGNKKEICGGYWSNSVYALIGKKGVKVEKIKANGGASDISGTWKWFDGETIHIYPNGTATDGFKGKWQANWNGSGFTYTINWNNGQYIDSLVLHGDTLDGHNQNGTHVWGKRITSSQHNETIREETRRIQKEKEKKAALAEKIRRIREEAEKKAEKPKTEQVDNIGGVVNGPKKPTTFRFNKSVKLLFLQTYHWNYGKGMTPPGKIGLRHSDGTMYGPWQSHGRPGQGGVPNANWEVNPNIPLKPGVYTVVDSDPKTWSTNAQEGWKGFAVIRTGPLNYPDEKAEGTSVREETRKIQTEKEKKAELADIDQTIKNDDVVSIKNPKVNGVALDYCREWAKNCGKPAADAWCQANGYSGSISYVLKNNTPPTRIISTKKICKSSFCGRIVEIKCRHKVADGAIKDRAEAEAKEKVDAFTKAALAKRIKAIREAAEERRRIQEEKEKKAALAEKIRKIREEAERNAVEAQKKIKSTEKFMGTLSGSWSGKGTGDWKGWTSNGTFVMNISKEGKISGNYSGDDNGKLSGSVSGLGKLNIKSGGGAAGTGTWGGSIKIDSAGKLSGNGFWSVDGFKGTWSGK